MPPPPRRRRPVQPATRVRLPRTARQRATPTGPATEPAPAGPANGGTGARNGVATRAAAQQEMPGAEAAAVAAGNEETAPPGDGGAETAATPTRDDAEAAATPTRDDAEAGSGSAGHVREPLLLPVLLALVAVGLGGLAVWFGLKSGGAVSPATGFGAGTENVAVVDRAATAQVTQQIDNAVDTIFSYSYADTARTARAAKTLLTGPASAQYATLFKVIERQAPAEKLVLTTTVTNSGVEMLDGDAARLLIFANQKDTGTAKGSTTEAGALFAVNAVRQDGRWKIQNINTFSSPG